MQRNLLELSADNRNIYNDVKVCRRYIYMANDNKGRV